MRAPPSRAQREVELAPLAGGESQPDRVLSVHQVDAVGQIHVELEPVDRRRRLDDDARRHLFTFERAVVLELDAGAQSRRGRECKPGPDREQERRRERDELGLREGESGQQPDGREARVSGEFRRGVARQVFARSSATGVGTVPSRSRTTSSAEMRCTQSSGRSVRRCARAGTATDLTSSGVT